MIERQKMQVRLLKEMPWQELCRTYLGFDPEKCPKCGKTEQEIIQTMLPMRGPPLFGKAIPKTDKTL